MVTHLATSKEVFTEFVNIRGNVKRVSNYNYYILVELVRDGYTAGKPEKYTFGSLNLLNMFYNLLVSSSTNSN